MNDCAFEDGWCGWHNYEDLLATERQQWLMYNCSSNRHADFRGLGSDVTFAGGTSTLTDFQCLLLKALINRFLYLCRRNYFLVGVVHVLRNVMFNTIHFALIS